MADVNDPGGGTVKLGESFTFERLAGGLTGVTYVNLVSTTYGPIACTSVSITSDTNGSATAPSSGLKHGETLKITFA